MHFMETTSKHFRNRHKTETKGAGKPSLKEVGRGKEEGGSPEENERRDRDKIDQDAN